MCVATNDSRKDLSQDF